ncbi:MAG: hypothetical protein ACP5G2_06470, partial [Candidatus Bipolaricaulaceae bacterium]
MRRLAWTVLLLSAILGAMGARGASVTPVVWGDDPGENGNPSCADVCSTCTYEYKLEPPAEGTFSGPGGFQVTISGATYREGTEMMSFDWAANYPVSVVIVKAGREANVYTYDPPVTSDQDLQPPGQPAISHI